VESRADPGVSSSGRNDHHCQKKPEKATVILRIALYAGVSSHEHKEKLECQAERLQDDCAAKGYQVAAVVKAIASGVHDTRPKCLALVRDSSITTIVVEHTDLATRFGFR
jgi:predicted site-specific integrase-resolvase